MQRWWIFVVILSTVCIDRFLLDDWAKQANVKKLNVACRFLQYHFRLKHWNYSSKFQKKSMTLSNIVFACISMNFSKYLNFWVFGSLELAEHLSICFEKFFKSPKWTDELTKDCMQWFQNKRDKNFFVSSNMGNEKCMKFSGLVLSAVELSLLSPWWMGYSLMILSNLFTARKNLRLILGFLGLLFSCFKE